MKILSLKKSDFKKCESNVTPKILINICDYLKYGLTDSNDFYRNYYIDPAKDYLKYKTDTPMTMGKVFYSTPLSYHIIANIVCVQLPKTSYNLIPFKLKWFLCGCRRVLEYTIKNDVKEIHTPVLGSKILEGEWGEILGGMIMIFRKNPKLESISIYQ